MGADCTWTAYRMRNGLAAFAAFCVGAAGPGSAIAADAALRPATKTAGAVVDSDFGFRAGSTILAPIPFTNDVIGSGLTLGAGYLFTLPGSRPSGLGLGYMQTSNGTVGYGLGGIVNFADGRWTLGAAAVDGDINYDLPVVLPFFGEQDISLTQSVTGGGVQLGYNFTPQFEASATLAYVDTVIKLDSDLIDELPDFLQPDLDIELGRLTFDLKYDTRDDTFYPTSGVVGSAAITFAEEIDSVFNDRFQLDDRSYMKNVFSLSGYRSVGENGILAGKAVLCGTSDDAPFFDTCGVGFVDGARGFSALSYLEDYSASAQVEFRGRLSQRIGYVAFADVGGGGDSIRDISTDNGGYAGGLGVRFRLSQQFALDYSADYAINNDGDGFLYLYLGQRF
ncbi:Surface antigen [Tropicimonas sediminicola]|uniref:Surface antigen n=2 Tax=Tropicimonas sediminicola TaxID=1031541 RepID=A0A239DEL3_9RHOB|nr:Surface antigen [Tropicimonas sediminicola]